MARRSANNEQERIWKEAVAVQLTSGPTVCVEGLNKATTIDVSTSRTGPDPYTKLLGESETKTQSVQERNR
jgi:hypothetical protein